MSVKSAPQHIVNMETRHSSCSVSLPGSEAQIRLCPEKFDETSTDEKRLPPVDGGFHAWMFLGACAMLEALIWGRFLQVQMIKKESQF
jgi:hypothetical protein